MIRAASLVVLVFLTAACVTEPGSKTKEVVAVTPKPVEDDKSAEEHELRVSRALIDLDKNVDEFAALASEAGDEARSKRDLLARALELQVAEFKRDLLAMAADPSNSVHRSIAVKALAFCDDPRAAVPVLVAALSAKGDVRLLTSATYALGRLASPTTNLAPMFELIKDADPDVRSNALLAIARIFDAKRAAGSDPLDTVLKRDVMTALEPAMFDPASPLVRAHAAAAMGALGDARGADPLINLLRDDHPLVRTQAAIALSKIGDMKAIPALLKAAETSPAGPTRHIVVLSLGTLLEKHGFRPPENLGDDPHAWSVYLRDVMDILQK